jgi:hypothetical protein
LAFSGAFCEHCLSPNKLRSNFGRVAQQPENANKPMPVRRGGSPVRTGRLAEK